MNLLNYYCLNHTSHYYRCCRHSLRQCCCPSRSYHLHTPSAHIHHNPEIKTSRRCCQLHHLRCCL
ncbi:hypothetical protein JB92DRAFT_2935907 [Gautieria morchelliformis]|nr:hypothetical protein JB92DRAFT_2935907 [Gautieria morchelliformis]